MPFGVDIPENYTGPTVEETAPDTSPEKEVGEKTVSESEEPEKGPIDLDSLETFRFKGKDLTKADLEKVFGDSAQRQDGEQTHSKSDFDSNYDADLAAVKLDPSRLGEFAAIYPREFVVKAIHELNRDKQQAGSQSNRSLEPNDPYASRFERYDRMFASMEARERQERVAKQEVWLEKQHSTLSKKYPDADPSVVDSKALQAHESGIKITDKVMERLFREDHEKREKYYEQKYRQKAENQLQANRQARDLPPGGTVMGSAGKEARTLKEAKEMALEAFGAK